MMQVVLWCVVGGNLCVALLVFILLGKPLLLQGILARVIGYRAEWQLGTLSREDHARLESLGLYLGQIGLMVLFIWSFLSGLLLKILAV